MTELGSIPTWIVILVVVFALVGFAYTLFAAFDFILKRFVILGVIRGSETDIEDLDIDLFKKRLP